MNYRIADLFATRFPVFRDMLNVFQVRQSLCVYSEPSNDLVVSAFSDVKCESALFVVLEIPICHISNILVTSIDSNAKSRKSEGGLV